MPFTFSHPAAILPLNYVLKKRSSLTALVIGSIVPDFEYFFRLHHRSIYSHTWIGLLWFDLPMGLLLCFVYHNLVRETFYSHAPLFLKRRMAPYQGLNWNTRFTANWPQILLCLFLGSLSHLLWDRVLHRSMPLTQAMAGYPDYTNYKTKMVGYYLWWSLHTGIGAFLVIFSLWHMPAAKNILPNTKLALYWACFVILSAAAMLFQLFNMLIIPDNVIIALINALFLGCLVTSFLFAIRWQKAGVALAVKEKG